jgi:hypothetical protein
MRSNTREQAGYCYAVTGLLMLTAGGRRANPERSAADLVTWYLSPAWHPADRP